MLTVFRWTPGKYGANGPAAPVAFDLAYCASCSAVVTRGTSWWRLRTSLLRKRL